MVHVRTVLPPNTVPIGWIAVGDPVEVPPPNEHEGIWSVQKPLDFPRYVFGIPRVREGESIMPSVMARYVTALRGDKNDRILEDN